MNISQNFIHRSLCSSSSTTSVTQTIAVCDKRAIATLLFFLTAPFINGSVQVIFQKKVAERVQGRVFALTKAISGIAIPLAALIAGPLADHVFEPLMAFDGPWSRNVIGHVIGSGPGRGIGLLFVIVGCFILVAALIGYQYPAIRQLEENLPDA